MMPSSIYGENKIYFLLNKYFILFSIIALPTAGVIVLGVGIIENINNMYLLFILVILLVFSGIAIMSICKEEILSNYFQISENYFILPYSTWNDIKHKKSPEVKYEEIKDIMFLSYGNIKEHFPGDPRETIYPLDDPWILGIRVILKDGREYNIYKKRVGLEGLSVLVWILKRKRKDIVLLDHLEIPRYIVRENHASDKL